MEGGFCRISYPTRCAKSRSLVFRPEVQSRCFADFRDFVDVMAGLVFVRKMLSMGNIQEKAERTNQPVAPAKV